MDITLLEQRAIEANVYWAMYETLAETLGEKAALDAVLAAARRQAAQAGRAFAFQAPGGTNFAHFKTILDLWRGSGALTIENVQSGLEELAFDVTRCAYVEAYRDMGMPEALAGNLSCCRDEPFATAYSPNIVMDRPETIGAGAPRCRFRFTWRTRTD